MPERTIGRRYLLLQLAVLSLGLVEDRNVGVSVFRHPVRATCCHLLSEDPRHSGVAWNCWTGPLARLGAARANAVQGNMSKGADADAARVRALAAYKDFLAFWVWVAKPQLFARRSKGGIHARQL